MSKIKFVILFFAFISSTIAQTISIETLNILERGLPNEEITTVLKDDYGFYWLSGYSFLYKYDGFKSTKIPIPLTSSEEVTNIFSLDSHNYVCTTPKKVISFGTLDPKEYNFNPIFTIPEDSNNFIIDAERNDENIYFLTFNALFRYNIESQKTDTFFYNSRKKHNLSLFVLNNKLIVTTVTHEMVYYENGEMDTIRLDNRNLFQIEKLDEDRYVAQSISPDDRKNNKLVIFKFDFNSPKISIEKTIDLNFKNRINEQTTNYIKISSDLFFIYTTNRGCFLVDINGNYIPINKTTGLPTHEIYSARKFDSEIILTSARQIVFIKNPTILQFNERVGLPDNNIWHIEKFNNAYYVATSTGLAKIVKKSPLQFQISEIPSFKSNSIYSIGNFKDKFLMVTLGNFNGYYQFDGNLTSFKKTRYPASISMINQFIHDKDDNFYVVGSNFVGIFSETNLESHPVTQLIKEKKLTVTKVQPLSPYYLVFTTDKEIFYYDKSTLKYHTIYKGYNLFSSYFFSLDTFIVSESEGPTLFVQGKDTIDLTNIVCTNRVYNIGYIPAIDLCYITDNGGVHFFDISLKSIYHLNELNGLPSNETNYQSIYIDDDSFWIGTTSGLAIIPFEHIKNISPYKIVTQTNLKFESYDQQQQIQIHDDSLHFTIPEKLNNITLQFSPIFPYKNNIFFTSYHLESPNLSFERGGHYRASFNDLPPGRYTINAQFFWKNPLYKIKDLNIVLTITQPFYKSWWFIALIIVLLSALIFLLLQIRSYRLKALNKKLNELVKKQTQNIEQYKSILEGVLRNIQEVIAVFDLEGNILLSNESAKQMNLNDMKHLFTLIPDELRANIEVIIKHKLKDSISTTEPISIGNLKYSLYFNPLLIDEQINGYSIFLVNITKILENEQLKTRIETLNQIFATFSHYLNNYLQSIVLHLDYYKISPESFDVESAVTDIYGAVDKIKIIIQNIEDILKSQQYETINYAGIENVLIKFNPKNDNNEK
ncbi:MAG: hypothetical protein Kow00108_04640 [Calditrichia bacterium]